MIYFPNFYSTLTFSLNSANLEVIRIQCMSAFTRGHNNGSIELEVETALGHFRYLIPWINQQKEASYAY